jgi:CDP-diacylglycerol--glycerol-3-phosphate 3-phosphatidyltransferase
MHESLDGRTRVDPGIKPEPFWTAANAVTLGRILLTPLLLLLPWYSGRFWSAVMGFGFLAISLTDLLDGYLARRHAAVTRIGKLLDPLADKLLVSTALVMLVAVGRIPDWALAMVVLTFFREFSVTGLRAMASAEGVIMPASDLGKWKTGFQIAALTALLIHHPLLGLSTHTIGLTLLALATALSVWSGTAYFTAFLERKRAG